MVSRRKVVAIGETGLDYHYDHSPRDIPKKGIRKTPPAFSRNGLPVIIHSREAKLIPSVYYENQE